MLNLIRRRLKLLLLVLLIPCLIFVVHSYLPPTTLTVLIGEEDMSYWQPLIAQFEQENQRIKIELATGSKISNELEKEYVNYFQENKYYDLVFLDLIWIAKFAEQGWLQNLDPFLDQSESEQYAQAFLDKDWQGSLYQGKLYRIPLHSDVSVLYYRRDLLNELGVSPPQSFVDVSNIYRQLKNKGMEKLGYLWQGRQYESSIAMFIEILQGYGGFWLNDAQEIGLTQEPAIKAIELLRELIKQQVSPKSVLSDDEGDTRRKFLEGKVVFMRNWGQAWQWLNQPNSPVYGKVGVTMMPKIENSKQFWSCQGGWGLGIAKKSKHPDAAWKAIQFFTRLSSQRQMALLGYIPSRKVLFNDPQLLKKYPYYPMLEESLKNSVLRPSNPYYPELSRILQEYLNQALASEKDPLRFMEAATKEMQEILKSV